MLRRARCRRALTERESGMSSSWLPQLVQPHDLVHVGLGLTIVRYAASLLDGAGAGVVGGEGEAWVAEALDHLAEIARAPAQVLDRVERVAHAQRDGRRG